MKPATVVFILLIVGCTAWLLWQQYGNNGDIDRDLLVAAKGNKALAKRLLAQAKVRYPGKSERWYVEKVIYDLERDRAGGRNVRSNWNMNPREMRENFYMMTAFLALLSVLSNFINNLFRGR